jgi:hypothetical protein
MHAGDPRLIWSEADGALVELDRGSQVATGLLVAREPAEGVGGNISTACLFGEPSCFRRRRA